MSTRIMTAMNNSSLVLLEFFSGCPRGRGASLASERESRESDLLKIPPASNSSDRGLCKPVRPVADTRRLSPASRLIVARVFPFW